MFKGLSIFLQQRWAFSNLNLKQLNNTIDHLKINSYSSLQYLF